MPHHGPKRQGDGHESFPVIQSVDLCDGASLTIPVANATAKHYAIGAFLRLTAR
jgi:hypothetical protein